LEALANAYRRKDLRSLFKKLKVHVPWEDYDDLKQITLAQWIHESGWGKSPLARLHLNFVGLKWRPEMESWVRPADYEQTIEKRNIVSFRATTLSSKAIGDF
jgi:flagellum-specific peptidoglycan hydrolase FlgJ